MFFPELEKPENIKILVVDDDDQIRDNIAEVLSQEGYQVYVASTGKEALQKVEEISPDIILTDYVMPEVDGIALCKNIKNNPDTLDIGVILITGLQDLDTKIKGLSAGADDFLTKPFLFPELIARIKSLAKIKKYRDFMKNYQQILEREVAKQTARLQKANLQLRLAFSEIKNLSLEVIYRLSKAAEYRDEHTGQHILRVSSYSEVIGKKLGLTDEQLELLKYGSPLHDIGKLGIPDYILLKPGKLTPDEWEIMKLHTIIGAEILQGSKIKYLKAAEKIALFHHERWDGKGYPYGLKGKKIPLFARITAIADVFDALTTNRPYRKAIDIDTAFKMIQEEAGTHFDPELVKIFLDIKKEIVEIKEYLKDEEELPNLSQLRFKSFLSSRAFKTA